MPEYDEIVELYSIYHDKAIQIWTKHQNRCEICKNHDKCDEETKILEMLEFTCDIHYKFVNQAFSCDIDV